ncbi:MAG: hypothetical protein WCF03_18930 [Nitrososphaeraceae archaeon]
MIFSNISSIWSTFAVISPEAGARREFYVNTATPLKSDAVRRYEDWFIRNTKKDDNTSYIENSTVVESRPKAVRNLDQPLTVLLAIASRNDKNATMDDTQQQGTSINMTQTPDINTYTDDGILVQHILDRIRRKAGARCCSYDILKIFKFFDNGLNP